MAIHASCSVANAAGSSPNGKRAPGDDEGAMRSGEPLAEVTIAAGIAVQLDQENSPFARPISMKL